MALGASLRQHTVTSYITVESGKSIYSFPTLELCKIRANSNYSDFHLADGTKHTIYGTLGSFEEQLAGTCFVRVNRSELANVLLLRQANVKHGAKMPGSGSITVSHKGMARLQRHHKKGMRSHKKSATSHKKLNEAV